MRTVILVPRRDGQRDRDATWAWVRQWWRDHLGSMEIFEGHHDEGLFNRSAAINRAAAFADWQREDPWDVAVIIDSDVICDPDHVHAAVAKAIETGRMVLPFDVRRDLNAQGSQLVMNGFRGSWAKYVHRTYTEMCSGVVVLTRGLWDAMSGFDETFIGWGFEDNAAAAAAETFSGGPIIKLPGEMWHLFHATAVEGKRGTPTHARNKARAELYLAARGDRAATAALRGLAVPAYEHRPSGIPKIIHRVVPEKTTREVEGWWREVERLHPDWELMTHRDPLDPGEWPETSTKWADCANGAQLADLVRLEALLRHGGIYLDSDVQPLRALDPLLPLSAFAAWEDERCVPNAVMGAVPGHPAIRACLDLALSRIPGDTWKAGPGVTTEILPGRDDVLLLPPGSLYPYHYKEKHRARENFKKTQPWAFVAHHWAHSWRSKDEKAS